MPSNTEQYNVALSADEIRALHTFTSSRMFAPRASNALVSAVDKLKWTVDFLDDPQTFASELDSITNR